MSRPDATPGPSAALARLRSRLETAPNAAVAVSGGVDSMTLAVVAHRAHGATRILHAVSPAVPPDATARVRTYAAREGWRLEVLDAGEMADARYLANPVNRCYFCKTRLYQAMGELTSGTLLSGTNLDDLGDYRPGLVAASEHRVRHPYVEAAIDKRAVRAIAASLGLDDLAELPAAPCLSSRVETGIPIEARLLEAIDDCEKGLRALLSPRILRCRLRRDRIEVEIDADALERLDERTRAAGCALAARRFARAGRRLPVAFSAYRRGSAFLHRAGDV